MTGRTTRRVEITGSGGDSRPAIRGLESIRVGMDGEARTNGEGGWEKECTACGRKLYEAVSGELLDWNQSTRCAKSPDGFSSHVPADVPLTWLNSFGVTLNEEEDSIQFHVSVGDPRGAMVMTLRKVDGQIIMNVPGQYEQHVRLEMMSGGAYRLG